MRRNGIRAAAFITSLYREIAKAINGSLGHDGAQLQRAQVEEFTKQFTGPYVSRRRSQQRLCDGQCQGDLLSVAAMERFTLGRHDHNLCFDPPGSIGMIVKNSSALRMRAFSRSDTGATAVEF